MATNDLAKFAMFASSVTSNPPCSDKLSTFEAASSSQVMESLLSIPHSKYQSMEDDIFFPKSYVYSEGSSAGVVKCSGVVQAPPESVLGLVFLVNTDYARRNHMKSSGTSLELYPNKVVTNINKHHSVVYSCRKMPFPLAAREWLTRRIFQVSDGGDLVLTVNNVSKEEIADIPPFVPSKLKDRPVRGDFSAICIFEKLPFGCTRFTHIASLDVKGNVPKAVAKAGLRGVVESVRKAYNFFQRDDEVDGLEREDFVKKISFSPSPSKEELNLLVNALQDLDYRYIGGFAVKNEHRLEELIKNTILTPPPGIASSQKEKEKEKAEKHEKHEKAVHETPPGQRRRRRSTLTSPNFINRSIFAEKKLSWNRLLDGPKEDLAVKKYFKFQDGDNRVWGKVTATIHASAPNALAWLWFYCSNNRMKLHQKTHGNLIRKYYEPVDRKVDNNRSCYTVVRNVMPIGIPVRETNMKVVWGEFAREKNVGSSQGNSVYTLSFTHPHEELYLPGREQRKLIYKPNDDKEPLFRTISASSKVSPIFPDRKISSSEVTDGTTTDNDNVDGKNNVGGNAYVNPFERETTITQLEMAGGCIIEPIAENICTITLVLCLNDRGIIQKLVNSTVGSSLNVVNELRDYFERNGAEVDSEIRNIFVANIPKVIANDKMKNVVDEQVRI